MEKEEGGGLEVGSLGRAGRREGGSQLVIIGHHDAMLIIYRRHTARRAKQLISQVY